MKLIDTHAHTYLEEFESDRSESIVRAREAGVMKILLPNIDSTSWDPLLKMCADYPEICLPMAGLHPTSVHPDSFEKELLRVEEMLQSRPFTAVGEIGIDLYWDKTHLAEQETAFLHQLKLAKQFNLPVAIHQRTSFNEIWKIIKKEAGHDLRGVFHCFSGSLQQAQMIMEAGFLLGIGGVVTYKNSGLHNILPEIGLSAVVLETDAPFLPPVPYRGQRNESAYLANVVVKISEIMHMKDDEVADITTRNAIELFRLENG